MGKIKNTVKKDHKQPMYKQREKKSKKDVKTKTKEDDSVADELEVDEDVLTLDVIKDLGGTEEDLELLDNIEGIDNAKEINDETRNELLSLVKSLNFSKFKSQFIVKDKDFDDEVKQEVKQEAAEDETKTNKKEENDVSSSSDVKEEDEKEDQESFGGKPDFLFLKEKTPSRSHCVIKTGAGLKWYEATNVEVEEETEESLTNRYWLQKLEKYTKLVWDKDVENYKKAGLKGSKRSETQWIQTVLKSGTLNDKFSAYVILLQDSPIHNLSVLETFVDLVSLKSRRPCLMAMESLQQIFVDILLLPTRKLRNFDKNPFNKLPELSGGNKETRDRYLISWMFEDRLKKMYLKFLDNLELVGKDSIDKTKIKSLSTTLELLAGNPEQESLLLERLINKLGDPSRTIAAKAMYLLSQLLERHSAMKWVVVGEVERLLYRPNISPKAQYFGICFLSQIILEKFNQDNLAAKLIKIYFSFFKVSVKKGEVDTKLMKALLTGVNRAFPYARLQPEELDQQMETIHKLVHLVSFNISIQALTLLYQVMDSREAVTDRFYSALYKKILDPGLTSSSKQVMFLNLLYKAMKADHSENRVRAFMKRLLQVISYQPSHLVCGLLFLISELAKARPDITAAAQPTAEADTEKFHDEDDDEKEHYEDVKEDEDDVEEKPEKKKSSGWTFLSKSSGHTERVSYDPSCRNPLYSGAAGSHYWELNNLQQHFHPSAALFAKNIRERDNINYTGDPLSDFTIARFLDRFVFRNPKKDPEKNKPSTVLGKRNIYRPAGIKAVAPDSKDFLNRDVSNVPSDELFIYKYFQEKLQRKGAKEDNEDAASVTSEEFNSFLDSYGRKSDFDDEDLDFAGGLGEKGEVDNNEAEDDASDDDENMMEDSDLEEPAGLDGEEEDDNFKDLSSGDESEDNMNVDDDADDLDEEGFDGGSFDEEGFGASDEEEEEKPVPKSKGKKKQKFGKFNAADLSSLLADAEEFSHLIEENDDSGMANSLANKDKASKKQLSWEKDNDNFMKKGKWTNKKKFNSKGKHRVKKTSSFKPSKK